MGKRHCCARVVFRCCQCCLVKQQDQWSRALMSSHGTFASREALIRASACPFCGLTSHTATDFHQPFKNLLMPLVFDWNWPDLSGKKRGSTEAVCSLIPSSIFVSHRCRNISHIIYFYS